MNLLNPTTPTNPTTMNHPTDTTPETPPNHSHSIPDDAPCTWGQLRAFIQLTHKDAQSKEARIAANDELIRTILETVETLRLAVLALVELFLKFHGAKGNTELRAVSKALEVIAAASSRTAAAVEAQAASTRDIAENTGNIYNAQEAWGEMQALSAAQSAGMLDDGGRKHLRKIINS
jgi:hypothetical protein